MAAVCGKSDDVVHGREGLCKKPSNGYHLLEFVSFPESQQKYFWRCDSTSEFQVAHSAWHVAFVPVTSLKKVCVSLSLFGPAVDKLPMELQLTHYRRAEQVLRHKHKWSWNKTNIDVLLSVRHKHNPYYATHEHTRPTHIHIPAWYVCIPVTLTPPRSFLYVMQHKHSLRPQRNAHTRLRVRRK